METTKTCPECGAAWVEGVTCQDHFYQMGYWEMENPPLGEVHHLMVLSYHLQHPSLYSPDGLSGAKALLVDFLERGLSPKQVRERDRAKVDSGNRKHKITGTSESHGAYTQAITWAMTAGDVVSGGMSHYIENVRVWARSILEALKTSGNL